jgi:hypothetical protein
MPTSSQDPLQGLSTIVVSQTLGSKNGAMYMVRKNTLLLSQTLALALLKKLLFLTITPAILLKVVSAE